MLRSLVRIQSGVPTKMHSVFETLIIALFKKEPCKKCLVRAKCSETCDDYKKFKRAMSNDKLLARASAWQLLILVFIIIPWCIYRMFQ